MKVPGTIQVPFRIILANDCGFIISAIEPTQLGSCYILALDLVWFHIIYRPRVFKYLSLATQQWL